MFRLAGVVVIGGTLAAVWWMQRNTRQGIGTVAPGGIRPGDAAIFAPEFGGRDPLTYWRDVMSHLYTSVGRMPIEGPLVTCITAPCEGTIRPQSP